METGPRAGFEYLTCLLPSPTVRPLFMNVLICDPVSPKGVALLQQRPEFKVTVLEKRLPEVELLPLVADVLAMVVRSETKVTKKVIEAAPNFVWWAAPESGWTTSMSRPPRSVASW